MNERKLLDQLKEISSKNPIPAEMKLQFRMRRLERMSRFYEDKAPVAPEKQGRLFIEFVQALGYAMAIIVSYRKLTKQLADTVKEYEDDIKTN